MKNRIFEINGTVLKNSNEPFTEKEKEALLDNFIDLLESKEYSFLGITK